MSALEVDAVLRRLPALELYSANVFRITGVSPGASDAQIRRRREEAELAARLGAAPGGAASRPAPETDTTGDLHALKDAFEALRNPVLRLVHELFWTWDVPGPHDEAVRAHSEALADGGPDAAWRAGLAAWAAALDDPRTWQHMEQRALELGDPRVGAATVERLRELAPLRVLAVGAAVAAAAAAAGDEAAATRHVALLAASPFGAALAARAVRDAVRPIDLEVRAAVEDAARAYAADPADAASAARRLLARAEPGLRVLARLLPQDHLTATLHDEVAHTVAAAAAAAYDADGEATGDLDEALELLDAAGALARGRPTAEQVARQRRAVADARVLAVVAPLQEAGKVDAARDVLRLWRRQCTDAGLREQLDRLVEDPRAVRAPVDDARARSGYLGCGIRTYGRRAEADDDTWVETRCLSVFGVPVYPLGSYLSDDRYVYAKVPMSAPTRWAQLLVLCLLAVVVALAVFGPAVAGATAAVLAALVAFDAAMHRRRTRGWLAEQLTA